MRVTEATVVVLNAFLSSPSSLSGAEIANSTGLMSGTLYPILHRLEANGMLSAQPEQVDPKEAQRPRRILYKLTAEGVGTASAIVRESRWAHQFEGAGKYA